MLAKIVFEKIFSNLNKGGFEVDYWGTETKKFGPDKPYFKIKINDPKALGMIVKKADLGLGEAYTAGIVEIDSIDQLIRLTVDNNEVIAKLGKLKGYKQQSNNKRAQARQIAHHYDLGNDFYQKWLDRTMTYTCAYYQTPEDSIEQAQIQKLDHVLRKLQLQKDMTFVDLGCGWGHLVIRGAKEYGAKGLGVTLSLEQYLFATDLAKKEGVEHLAKFEHLNYQELINRKVQYDRVISIGMLEHVGDGNLSQYFDVVDHVLKPGGVSVLHAITQQVDQPMTSWLDKYIFPGAHVFGLRNIVSAMPDYDFRLVDYENLRYHYYLTCYAWLKNFDALKSEMIEKYDENFYRMWRFYLAGCGSSFKYGINDLSQFVFTKGINNDLPLTREFLYQHPKATKATK